MMEACKRLDLPADNASVSSSYVIQVYYTLTEMALNYMLFKAAYMPALSCSLLIDSGES